MRGEFRKGKFTGEGNTIARGFEWRGKGRFLFKGFLKNGEGNSMEWEIQWRTVHSKIKNNNLPIININLSVRRLNERILRNAAS